MLLDVWFTHSLTHTHRPRILFWFYQLSSSDRNLQLKMILEVWLTRTPPPPRLRILFRFHLMSSSDRSLQLKVQLEVGLTPKKIRFHQISSGGNLQLKVQLEVELKPLALKNICSGFTRYRLLIEICNWMYTWRWNWNRPPQNRFQISLDMVFW